MSKHQDKRIAERGIDYTTNTAHTRVNRGYKLREDLIKSCKRIALEEDRNLYEVMEEALEEYLARRNLPR